MSLRGLFFGLFSECSAFFARGVGLRVRSPGLVPVKV